MSTLFSVTGQNSLPNWGSYLARCEQEEAAYQRFKWEESEKQGYDIGHERADWLWITRERTRWIARQLGQY